MHLCRLRHGVVHFCLILGMVFMHLWQIHCRETAIIMGVRRAARGTLKLNDSCVTMKMCLVRMFQTERLGHNCRTRGNNIDCRPYNIASLLHKHGFRTFSNDDTYRNTNYLLINQFADSGAAKYWRMTKSLCFFFSLQLEENCPSDIKFF